VISSTDSKEPAAHSAKIMEPCLSITLVCDLKKEYVLKAY